MDRVKANKNTYTRDSKHGARDMTRLTRVKCQKPPDHLTTFTKPLVK